MTNILKRIDVKFKIILLGLFIFLYMIAGTYPEKSKKFPQLIAFCTIIILILSLIIDFTRREKVQEEIIDVGDTELTKPDETLKKARKNRFYKAWIIILISTAIGFWGGFLITTFLLLIGFPILFGGRKNLPKNIAVAIIITVIIFFTFQWIFGISLLKGI